MIPGGLPPDVVAGRLRRALLECAAGAPPQRSPVSERPAFILGPGSVLGRFYAGLVIARLARPVAVVDDVAADDTLYGLPRWTSRRFAQQAREYPEAVAIDFSTGPLAEARFAALCRETGVERRDMVGALAEFDLHSVYESVPVMRSATLTALDRLLRLESRFEDDLSRATLYAALLLRLSFDRRWLAPVLLSGEDEYFTQSAAGATFRLSDDETFCDAGAHTGTVVKKFLAATRWHHAGIHAFEPDRANFAALAALAELGIGNFHPRQYAVSDRRESLRFLETGTMSSHVSDRGESTCEAVPLDDIIDRASFIKLDVEGFEAKALSGARRILNRCSPRLAIAAYHHPLDMADIVDTLDALRPGYRLHLRHHFNFYYDTLLYASPVPGWLPPGAGIDAD